jgi:hypothetical protein
LDATSVAKDKPTTTDVTNLEPGKQYTFSITTVYGSLESITITYTFNTSKFSHVEF